MGQRRAYFLFALKAAISLLLLRIAIGFVNFSVLRERLGRLDYTWIALAAIILLVQVGLVALRWQWVAGVCGAGMSGRRAALYTLVGTFFSQVLPSTVGGDAARVWLLARDSGKWKSAVYSVLIDRAAGLIWLAVIVLALLPWSLALIRNPVGCVTLVLIGGAGAVAPLGLFVLSRLGRTSFGQWRGTRHLTEIAATAWRTLSAAPTGAAVAAVSIAIHLISVFVLWTCARAIGSPFTLANSLLLFPPVILIAAIPISIAGWGVRESAMLAAFTYAGLPESDGLLVSILFGAATFAVGAIGGIAWSLSANRVRIGALRNAGEKAMDA